MIQICHKVTGEVLRQVEAPSLGSADLRGADLAYADLAAYDLRGADLQSARLVGASFSQASPAEPDLSGGDLFHTDPQADLRVMNSLHSAGRTVAHARRTGQQEALLSEMRAQNTAHLERRSWRDVVGALPAAAAGLLLLPLTPVALAAGAMLPLFSRRSAARLTGANLQGANLQDANLSGVDLSRADLRGANLSGACFFSSNCTRLQMLLMLAAGGGPLLISLPVLALSSSSHLFGLGLVEQIRRFFVAPNRASLAHADLSGAVLRDAGLTGVNLTHANLRNADLQGAKLAMADLSRADLRGANLRGARLVQARMRGARADRHTRWPEGFHPGRAVGMLVPA